MNSTGIRHYFYSDPLKAAYMAKRYGMRFRIKILRDGHWDGEWLEAEPIPTQKIPYYIHPDSLQDLEKISDIKKAAMKELGLWLLKEQDS